MYSNKKKLYRCQCNQQQRKRMFPIWSKHYAIKGRLDDRWQEWQSNKTEPRFLLCSVNLFKALQQSQATLNPSDDDTSSDNSQAHGTPTKKQKRKKKIKHWFFTTRSIRCCSIKIKTNITVPNTKQSSITTRMFFITRLFFYLYIHCLQVHNHTCHFSQFNF